MNGSLAATIARPVRPLAQTTKRRIFIIHGSHNLTDHAFNGDGLVAWGYINELARRGHTLHVATDRLDVAAKPPPNLTLVEFPRVERNPALHYLSYIRQVRAYYDRLAATEGVDVVHQMNPVVRGISLGLLGKDVPVVLGTYVGDWVRLQAAPNYRKPTLSKRASALLKSTIDAVQQHYATSLILASPHALKRVPLSGDVGDRVEFMHHGVDTELYAPEASPSDPPAVEGRILYVGAIQINKGVLTLADAFARVLGQVPTASLVVVGAGNAEAALTARLAELGILERVRFTGRATRGEVAGWLRSSAVLCAPSFGEPYGQNVLEAMATAKPVVITTEGGHRYLGDAAGATFFEPGNVAQLTDALSAILLEPERARAMGRHNREVALERHAWSKVTDRLETIYERAIAAHRRESP